MFASPALVSCLTLCVWEVPGAFFLSQYDSETVRFWPGTLFLYYEEADEQVFTHEVASSLTLCFGIFDIISTPFTFNQSRPIAGTCQTFPAPSAPGTIFGGQPYNP